MSMFVRVSHPERRPVDVSGSPVELPSCRSLCARMAMPMNTAQCSCSASGERKTLHNIYTATATELAGCCFYSFILEYSLLFTQLV